MSYSELNKFREQAEGNLSFLASNDDDDIDGDDFEGDEEQLVTS